MTIGTAVFQRIVKETAETAAVKALCVTFGETARFGSFTPDVLVPLAESRIDSWKTEKGW